LTTTRPAEATEYKLPKTKLHVKPKTPPALAELLAVTKKDKTVPCPVNEGE
jgi:hypothetical protein